MANAVSAHAHAITDLVELIQSRSHASNSETAPSVTSGATHTLPSSDTILTTLATRYKAEQAYINCGYSTLIAINPLRPLENLNDASAQSYLARIIGGDDDDDDDDQEDEDAPSPRSVKKRKENDTLQPHPYEFAARIHLALQRTGKSQAVVFR